MPPVEILNCRRPDGLVVDLSVEEGRLSEVRLSGAPRRDDSPVEASVDAGGLLVLPTLVDAHAHPDKTTWGEPWLSRAPATTIADFIDNDVRTQKQMSASVAERSRRLLESYVAAGARGMRAHVDVAPPYGTGNVEGVATAAAALRHALHVEIVAFPQLGILRSPGTAELMADAVGAGASIIGGLDPVGIDGDPDGHLDVVFGLAERFGLPVDIHLHDRGDEGIAQVEQVIARTAAAGMQGLVTLGHAFCYADCDDVTLGRLAQDTAAAGITLATAALGADPIIPVARLRAEGVRVVLGSDGVRDAWSPFGNGNMLDRAHLLAWRTGAVTDEDITTCFDIAAHAGAELLGLEAATLTPGAPADFMLLAAENVAAAVIDRPTPAWVLRAGRVVARAGHTTSNA